MTDDTTPAVRSKTPSVRRPPKGTTSTRAPVTPVTPAAPAPREAVAREAAATAVGPVPRRPARAAAEVLRSACVESRPAVVRLLAWTLLSALPALVSGKAMALAVDRGFLGHRPGQAACWLALFAVAALIGAWAARQTYPQLAHVVEPMRDRLVRRLVSGLLHRGVAARGRPDASTATAVAQLTRQVEAVRDSMAGQLLVVSHFALTAVAVLGGTAMLAPAATPLIAAPLLLALAGFAATTPVTMRRQRRAFAADENLARLCADTLTALRDIVTCGARGPAERELLAAVTASVRANRALAVTAAVRRLLVALGAHLPLLLVVLAAPALVRRGLTPGEVMGVLAYLTGTLEPALRLLVQGVGSSWLRLAVAAERLAAASQPPPASAGAEVPRDVEDGAVQGEADGSRNGEEDSARRAEENGARSGEADDARHVQGDGSRPPDTVVPAKRRPVGVTPPKRRPDPAPDGGHGHSPADGSVRLRDVSYSYGAAAEPVFDALDLTLHDGEHLAVVGPSGVGKSTLADVLAGDVPPDRGDVVLGGTAAGRLGPEELARVRVLLPQDAYVFAGELQENLRWLHPGASERDVMSAVRALGAAPLVERLGGLEATVDPAALSAGERQILALVRAHLSPVRLVILDEATRHLDARSELQVEEAFRVRPGTVVTITHRPGPARGADRVLFLDGERALVGTHSELLSTAPGYRALVGGHGVDLDPTD
ncbi:ATP-binding cassette domain-containing protein [Streptomyces fagopyri]|uniref:ATP-binding cassette domain-containing protein n=1 Tax=Streptomyces fagopyri TaxID=2662397 RepID=UPI0037FD9220